MAVLTVDELARLRQDVEAETSPACVKAVLNAASQAIEDYFENTARAGLSAALDAATQPLGVTFSVVEKRRLVKVWLRRKFERGG